MRRADVAEARAKAAESKLGSIAKLAQGGAPVDVCPMKVTSITQCPYQLVTIDDFFSIA